MWRPLTAERPLAKLWELEERYSLDDLRDMHLALDVLDELTAKVAAKQKELAEAKR